MKMISSTSITSTIGVTLISAITAARRRPRRPPPPAEPAMFIAMILLSRCARHLPPRGGPPPPAAPAPPGRPCHVHRHDLDLTMRSSFAASRPLVDLAGQDGGKIIGGGFWARRLWGS